MEHSAEAHENPSWIALVVRPRAERKVQAGLSDSGIESFVAWHGVRRRWSDRIKVVQQNLFPGYVFCRSRFSDRLLVMRQPGVERAVSFNQRPVEIPDEEISALRRVISSGLPLGPWPFLKSGQRVRIENGLLTGIEGTLVGDDSGAWRLAINVSALEQSVAIEVSRDMIRPIGGNREGPLKGQADTYGCK